MVSQHREREDKYAVGEGFRLPDLADLTGDGGRLETAEHGLVNLYHDTPEGDLGAAGVTLRRRSGGGEDGWQLKLPSGAARTEVRSSDRSETVPAELADVVFGLTRGAELRPVAELTTQRVVTRLLDGANRLRAEVADDRVSSTTSGDVARLDHWHEIEVELGEAGDEELLTTIGARLVAAGAKPSAHQSKVARALGATPPEPGNPFPPATLGDLVTRYVRAQCEEILAGDLALRLGEPRVHKTRVAIRRLRSTLRVFAELFDADPAGRLETELRRFALLLGEVRDREVLQERIDRQVAELPAELVLGPVAADVAAVLGAERAEHLRRVTEELRGERHLALLEALARWRSEPPLLERAGAPASEVRRAVRAAREKVRKRLRRARRSSGATQDELLHGVRKAAKRARYAAELAVPARPGAARHVERAQALQTALGEHQDSVVAAAFLRRMGAEAAASPDRNGFTYGLLYAREQERAERVRSELDQLQA